MLNELYQAKVKTNTTEVLQTMGSEIRKLTQSGILENSKSIGDKAPDFELMNSEGELV